MKVIALIIALAALYAAALNAPAEMPQVTACQTQSWQTAPVYPAASPAEPTYSDPAPEYLPPAQLPMELSGNKVLYWLDEYNCCIEYNGEPVMVAVMWEEVYKHQQSVG